MTAVDGLPSPSSLTVWKRRLTPAQRKAELDYRIALVNSEPIDFLTDFLAAEEEFARRDPATREDWLPTGWYPLLPTGVSRCRICTLPHRNELCKGCATVLELFGRPFASLEFLCVAGKLDEPEKYIWDWKKVTWEWPGEADDRWIAGVGTGLSAYLEAHRDRLAPAGTVVTTVPSRAPTIATALRTAADRGWYAVEPIPSGRKLGEWFQHGSRQEERLSRTNRDWEVDGERIKGRDVLLLDDVWVTGASSCTYAMALRAAGARSVRCLAVVRHLDSRNVDYWDALRIVWRQTSWSWSVKTTSACQPRP